MATLTNQNDISLFQLITIKHGLALECKGMTRRGRSCYAIAKDILGITGRPPKAKVLEEFSQHVQQLKEKRDERL